MAEHLTRDIMWIAAYFDLARRQEVSRTAVATQVRDLGPALWRVDYTTIPLPLREIHTLQVKLQDLGGALETFFGHTAERPRPEKFYGGENLSAVKVASVSGNRREIGLSGLPNGFRITIGDFLTVSASNGSIELLRAREGASANSSGAVTGLRVTPHVRPSVRAGNKVTMINPFAELRLLPGGLGVPEQVSGNLHRLSFSAMQVIR